ncbi:endonuclease/exonuclease/phosphatase family protein [Sphingobacterium deserti]|uniref:Endonuclease/exonuclease/phosphatase n=1 Tax=Sphingobacterium deserti TaxID=1229276 RepID=A0A0B8T485_9SPHI|nr:endonuclease/exonuclease/phosphatase family protein [Sphingobacterium deserti]KGE14238.1 endonuclease/exonuclease/phosphatase [Sphingobacterium deserti]
MNLKKLGAVALLFIISFGLQAQQITLGSYNIRYDNPADTGNLWVDRAPVVANLIRFHDFDILGTQEGFKNQLDDIARKLPEYSRYGKGRDDGKEAGEHSAIFYKKDRFTLLKSGDFWLAENPSKPGLGWDATCCNRICSWVQLNDVRNGKSLYVFNVHFDHQGVVAREESAKLILAQIKKIAGDAPVLLTGDFNGDRESSWYKRIADSGSIVDVHAKVSHPYQNNSSANAFRKPKNNRVIDHVFMSKHFDAIKWGILTDTYFGKFPSDHFPILTVLELK